MDDMDIEKLIGTDQNRPIRVVEQAMSNYMNKPRYGRITVESIESPSHILNTDIVNDKSIVITAGEVSKNVYVDYPRQNWNLNQIVQPVLGSDRMYLVEKV